MSRSWSAASGGPSVSTVTEPPGDLDGFLDRALLVRADREPGHPGVDVLPVRRDDDLAADHRDPLDADQDFHAGQLLIRAFSGSNSGVEPATATVTGYCSAMYSTARRLPSRAWAAGRYAISRCLPTDGPDPALVT